MDSFGEYLKRERELRGVTLEEIANATNISVRFLVDLENDEYNDLPAEVFVKGFIRAYAKCIGTDSNEVILAYEEWIARKKNKEKEEGEKKVDFLIKGDWKKRSLCKLSSVVILAGVIILIGIIFYAIGGDEEHKNVSNEQLLASEREIIPEKTVPVEKEGERDEIEDVNRKDMMTLTVIALEDAWFRIEIDDAQVKDFILPRGGMEDIKAEEKFVITIGNKKGTHLRLNGKEITPPLTDYNVVRNFVLTREEIDQEE
ncbi:MAG: RodZ domain-containing protein [Nitrospinota bacterium]